MYNKKVRKIREKLKHNGIKKENKIVVKELCD